MKDGTSKDRRTYDRHPQPREKAHDPLLVDQESPIGDHEQVSNPNTTVGGYGHGRDAGQTEPKDTQKNSNDKLGEKQVRS